MSSVIILDSSDEDEVPAKRISIPRLNPATTITIVKTPAKTKNNNKPNPAPSIATAASNWFSTTTNTSNNNNNNNNKNYVTISKDTGFGKTVISDVLLPSIPKAAISRPKPSTLPKINAAFTLNTANDRHTPTPPKKSVTPTRLTASAATNMPTATTTNAAVSNLQQQQRKRKAPTPPRPKANTATPQNQSPLLPMMMMMMNNATAPMMSMFNSMHSMAPSSMPPLQLLATPASSTTAPSFGGLYQPAMQAMQSMQAMNSVQNIESLEKKQPMQNKKNKPTIQDTQQTPNKQTKQNKQPQQTMQVAQNIQQMQQMQPMKQYNNDNFKIHLPLKQPNTSQPSAQPNQAPKPAQPMAAAQATPPKIKMTASTTAALTSTTSATFTISTTITTTTTTTTTTGSTASILRSIKRIKPTTLLSSNDEAWLKRQQKTSSSPSPTSLSTSLKYNNGMEVFPTALTLASPASFTASYPVPRTFGLGMNHIRKSTSQLYSTQINKPGATSQKPATPTQHKPSSTNVQQQQQQHKTATSNQQQQYKPSTPSQQQQNKPATPSQQQQQYKPATPNQQLQQHKPLTPTQPQTPKHTTPIQLQKPTALMQQQQQPKQQQQQQQKQQLQNKPLTPTQQQFQQVYKGMASTQQQQYRSIAPKPQQQQQQQQQLQNQQTKSNTVTQQQHAQHKSITTAQQPQQMQFKPVAPTQQQQKQKQQNQQPFKPATSTQQPQQQLTPAKSASTPPTTPKTTSPKVVVGKKMVQVSPLSTPTSSSAEVVPTAIYPTALFPRGVVPKSVTVKHIPSKNVTTKAPIAQDVGPKSFSFASPQMIQMPKAAEKPIPVSLKPAHNHPNVQRLENQNPTNSKSSNVSRKQNSDTPILDLTDSPEKSKENAQQSSWLTPPAATGAATLSNQVKITPIPRPIAPKPFAINGKTTENGTPPTATTTTKVASKVTESVVLTDEDKALDPPIPTYQELLKICREIDPSDDMEKLIKIKLLRYYYLAEPDYVYSKSFIMLVRSTNERIKANRDMIYYNLKIILDDLKGHRKNAVQVDAQQRAEEEGSFTTTGNLHIDSQIRKLNRELHFLTKEIKRLEELEVDWDDDDSSYLKVERFKKRACQVYEKICELSGERKSGMKRLLKPIQFNGTKLTQFNRKLQAYVNKTQDFPDYFDVVRMLEHCNTQYSMGLAHFEVKHIAQDAFIKVGKLLQKRRKTDLYETVSHYTSNRDDPAENDPTLLAKLSENQKLKKNINEVFEKYARKQDLTAEKSRLKRAATAAEAGKTTKAKVVKKKSSKMRIFDDSSSEDGANSNDDDRDDDDDVDDIEEDIGAELDEEDADGDDAEEDDDDDDDDVETIEIDNDTDRLSTDRESDKDVRILPTKTTDPPTNRDPLATTTTTITTTKSKIVGEKDKLQRCDMSEKTVDKLKLDEKKINNNTNNNNNRQNLSSFVRNIFARGTTTNGSTQVADQVTPTKTVNNTTAAPNFSPNVIVTIRRNATASPNTLKRASSLPGSAGLPALKVMSVSRLNNSINPADPPKRVFLKTPAANSASTKPLEKPQNSVAEIVISDEES